MAESVVSFVVERVGDLLIQEARFLAGVSDQVRQIKTELQRMQCFLKDADKRQDKDELVRGWVSEIRELAYDVENVIETFVLDIASRREKGFSKKFKRYATIFIEAVKIHQVGKAIEAIQARITNLTTSLTTYGIQIKSEQEGSTSMQQKLKRSYSHLVQEHTVGLDNDVKSLIARLRGEETGVGQNISICGMGGLGKTTLANKIYHHVKIRDHFDAFAWYCVSQQFQAREVWEGILIKLESPSIERREKISKMKYDEIAKELYLFQQKKKCLVVLDDIWREDAWDLLKPAFPVGKTTVGGSRIVLTTRNKVVASYANQRAFIHELQPLNEEDSWKLFQETTFPERDYPGFQFNMNMKKIGMKILRKCAGLPLAIVVLGGLLATKDSLSEWEKVHENVDLYLSKGNRTDQDYSIVHGVLALSYNELPYHLKPCFLHLGNFSEDYDIPCKTLLKMWVAEGFVMQCQHVGEGNETKEDVVERYLHDLINRSIVLVSQIGSTGRVKTCRLHDLMRDFCLSKANQENYLEIVRATNLYKNPYSNRVHRLVLHRDIHYFDHRYYIRTPYLRSFFLQQPNFQMIRLSFSYFKLLRILSLEKCKIWKEVGKEIGGLIYLRYLAFEDCNVDDLPSSIGNLRYLQTLIIRGKPFRVPNVLWKLEHLRHLILRGMRCDIKRSKLLKLGNMRMLQTLECSELVNSSNLKSSCPHLLKLSYRGIIRYGLPEWQHFPPNLTNLTLTDCLLEEDPMPILENLSNLRILRMRWRSFEGKLLVCSSKGFPKLQTLHLHWIERLEEWRVDEEAMPNLSQLHVVSCMKLRMIPEGIKFITTLRQLEIRGMPKEFVDRVRVVDGTEGEDFYKVQHVSSILILFTSTA